MATCCGPSVLLPATPSILPEGRSFPCSGNGSPRVQVSENSRNSQTCGLPPSALKTPGSHQGTQPWSQEMLELKESPCLSRTD